MKPTTKYFLWGLGVVAVGTGGYLLYRNLRSKTDAEEIDAFKEDVSTQNNTPSVVAPKQTRQLPRPTNSTFPLSYGSKGTLVKDLQNVLIKKYGGGILPKYGADGYWGKELDVALKSKGLPTHMDSVQYAKITVGKKEEEKPKPKPKPTNENVNVKAIASELHDSIRQDDVFKALKALAKIKNKETYVYVNEEFKKTRAYTFVDAWVSQTVVNALLNQFSSEAYKKAINAELFRIGLKYDGSKWSLSGFDSNPLVTVEPAKIWDRNGRTLQVPASIVIGQYIRANNGITEFQTPSGDYFFISTYSIRYSHD